MADNKNQQTQQVKIRYNETTAQFASQFIVNTTNEEIIINFSSGPLSDPNTGETLLPIHTRLALTKGGAKRLQAVLASVLKQEEKQTIPDAAQAQLPKVQ